MTLSCAAQNRLERLRTPNKVRVYAEGDLSALLADGSTAFVLPTNQLTPNAPVRVRLRIPAGQAAPVPSTEFLGLPARVFLL
jgi:hypothetical protein